MVQAVIQIAALYRIGPDHAPLYRGGGGFQPHDGKGHSGENDDSDRDRDDAAAVLLGFDIWARDVHQRTLVHLHFHAQSDY